jgi:hypothetical protein
MIIYFFRTDIQRQKTVQIVKGKIYHFTVGEYTHDEHIIRPPLFVGEWVYS